MSTLTAQDKPRIELRKVKHAKFASEETECFEAEVWVNGVAVFTARNDGRGGCNFYDPLRPFGDAEHAKMREAMQTVQDWCKVAPEVPRPKHYGSVNGRTGYQPDLDSLVGDALNEWLQEKQWRRILASGAKKWLLTDGRALYTIVKAPQTAFHGVQLERIRAKYPDQTVMNLLPESEAMALLKTLP